MRLNVNSERLGVIFIILFDLLHLCLKLLLLFFSKLPLVFLLNFACLFLLSDPLFLLKYLEFFLLLDEKHTPNELILNFVELALPLNRQKLALIMVMNLPDLINILRNIVDYNLIGLNFLLYVHHLLENLFLFHLLCLFHEIVSGVIQVLLDQVSNLCRKIGLQVDDLLIADIGFELFDILKLLNIHWPSELLRVEIQTSSPDDYEELGVPALDLFPSSVSDKQSILRLRRLLVKLRSPIKRQFKASNLKIAPFPYFVSGLPINVIPKVNRSIS